jgi:hypothetical protein
MDSNLTGFDEEDHTRPTLLTVLCILTFIGSSWLILTNIWTYGTASKTAEMISAVSKRAISDSAFQKDSTKAKVIRKKRSLFGEKIMSSMAKIMTADNIRKNAAGTILSALITLFGALLMWWLKRRGFYIYMVGTLLGIIIPLYFYGINMTSMGIAFFPGFFGLVFIALYALNFKSLR